MSINKENQIELLAPAGSKESFFAAINAGANAVYLGGKLFSARAYASNFDNEELASLIKYAHIHNVKVNITCNTLIFDDEFDECIKFIDFLYKHDVDAILIQDLGLASYLHKTYPSLVLHASTQLNCHNVNEAKALINLGFKRIVLAREVSIEEAKKIKELGVEVEVFVHGALCVSYSGNCLMSSFIGGRSGNRGRCAQPCRNEMRVVGNSKISDKFALSTKDICSISYLEELISIGIDSLKIEGRMKREEYVYKVVSSYRKALDAYYEKKDISLEKDIEEMKSLFNRGLSKSFLLNESRTTSLNQKTSSHQGTHLGKVIKIEKDYIYILLDDDLSLFDGIRFNNEYQNGQEVQKMFVNSKEVTSAYKGQVVKLKAYKIKANINEEVIKTTSKALIDEIGQVINVEKKTPLKMLFKAKTGNNLEISFISLGQKVSIQGEVVDKSISSPITKETIIKQMGKLGETSFFLEDYDIDIDENIFISLKSLNEYRRKLVSLIEEKINNFNAYPLDNINKYPYSNVISEASEFSYLVQVETKEQYEVVKNYPFKKILVQNKQLFNELKDDERVLNTLNRIEHFNDVNVMDRSVISYLKVIEGNNDILTSPYFNLINFYALDFIYSLGINEAILSYELDKEHIEMMMKKYFYAYRVYPKVALPIYGKIDLMIMKSCPIASSEGMKKDHCNMCKKHEYHLVDGINNKYEMLHDEACTTRILSSNTLYLLDKIEELKQMHISHGVIYFTSEEQDEVELICKQIFSLDKLSKNELPFKITTGHFYKKIL